MSCQAYQSSDQMVCGACGLQWDVIDTEPPTCRNKRIKGLAARVEKLEPLAKGDSGRKFDTRVPAELSAEHALEIAKAYEAQRAFGQSVTQSMQRAYRVFLDQL